MKRKDKKVFVFKWDEDEETVTEVFRAWGILMGMTLGILLLVSIGGIADVFFFLIYGYLGMSVFLILLMGFVKYEVVKNNLKVVKRFGDDNK